jgi:La domain
MYRDDDDDDDIGNKRNQDTDREQERQLYLKNRSKRNLHPAAKWKRILSACDFWFSRTNLLKDDFMRETLKRHSGTIPIQVLLTFPKLQHWTTPSLLIEAFTCNNSDRYQILYNPELWNQPSRPQSQSSSVSNSKISRSTRKDNIALFTDDYEMLMSAHNENDDSDDYNTDSDDEEKEKDSDWNPYMSDLDTDIDNHANRSTKITTATRILRTMSQNDMPLIESQFISEPSHQATSRMHHHNYNDKSNQMTEADYFESSTNDEREDTTMTFHMGDTTVPSSFHQHQSDSAYSTGNESNSNNLTSVMTTTTTSNYNDIDIEWKDLDFDDNDDDDEIEDTSTDHYQNRGRRIINVQANDGSDTDDDYYDHDDDEDGENDVGYEVAENSTDHYYYPNQDVRNAFLRHRRVNLEYIAMIEEEISQNTFDEDEDESMQQSDDENDNNRDLFDNEDGESSKLDGPTRNDNATIEDDAESEDDTDLVVTVEKTPMKKYGTSRPVKLITTTKQLRIFCTELVRSAEANCKQHKNNPNAYAIGMDVEYCTLEYDIRNNLPAMIQLSGPTNQGPVGLIWIHNFPNYGRDLLTNTEDYGPLILLLADPKLFKVGVSLSRDTVNLAQWCGISDKKHVDYFFSGVVNLDEVQDNDNVRNKSLQEMAELVLHRLLPKVKGKRRSEKDRRRRVPTAHWRTNNITGLMKSYAANDVACAIDVWSRIHNFSLVLREKDIPQNKKRLAKTKKVDADL